MSAKSKNWCATQVKLVAALLLLAFGLDQWRYQPPAAVGASASPKAMVGLCGFTLPGDARVVAFSGEHQRNKDYQNWIIFYESEPLLPGSLERVGDVFRPTLEKAVPAIEALIVPHKIERPKGVKDYGWSHGGCDMRAIAVSAQKGTYVRLDSVRQTQSK